MAKYDLKLGKDQKIFDERLKNNEMRTIKHGIDGESCYCRICEFSDIGTKGMFAKAGKHAQQTGHTIDIYTENWREITYYKKRK